jgi:hypothetical protein
VPQLPNDRWSLDFVADQFIDGRRIRILVVVDDGHAVLSFSPSLTENHTQHVTVVVTGPEEPQPL